MEDQKRWAVITIRVGLKAASARRSRQNGGTPRTRTAEIAFLDHPGTPYGRDLDYYLEHAKSGVKAGRFESQVSLYSERAISFKAEWRPYTAEDAARAAVA